MAAFAVGSRSIDELLERTPESQGAFERFDADAHLVAVLNAVVHIEAVYRRPNQASQDCAAFSCFPIHVARLRVTVNDLRGRR